MIRAILIDFDGVIRRWDAAYDDGLMRAMGLPIDVIGRIAFDDDLLTAAVTGRITDEEWRDRVVERLARLYPALDARAAVAAWSRPIGHVNEPVRALVASWRRRVPVALVSNATSRLPADLDALGLTGAFDVVVNSSAIGVAKPDPAIFRDALDRIGARPEETLLIDDTASHLAAARQLGLQTVHFTGDVDGLRAFVAERLAPPEGDRERGALR